jgi:hypothetical protein
MAELLSDSDPGDVDGFDAPTNEQLSANAQMFVLNLQFSGQVTPRTAALLLSRTPDAATPFGRAVRIASAQHATLDQSGGPG